MKRQAAFTQTITDINVLAPARDSKESSLLSLEALLPPYHKWGMVEGGGTLHYAPLQIAPSTCFTYLTGENQVLNSA